MFKGSLTCLRVFYGFLWMKQAISAISAIHFRAGAHYVLRSAKLCAERLFELLNKYAARKHMCCYSHEPRLQGANKTTNHLARSAALVLEPRRLMQECPTCNVASTSSRRRRHDKTCLKPTQISICQQAKLLHSIGWVSLVDLNL